MADSWTVQEAKAKLSEILRRARAGEPQRIGESDACYVVSAPEWERLKRPTRTINPRFAPLPGEGLGAWIVRTAPRVGEIELPSRKSDRLIPFGPTKSRKAKKK